MPKQDQQQEQQEGQQEQDGAGEKPVTFDAWLAEQDDTIKGLYESHTAGLKNALRAEREQRRTESVDLLKQLREATKGATEGSEAKKALEGVTARLEQAELRAGFFEDAAKPEIGCANPRLAFIAAQEIGAIDGKGRVHWDDLRSQFPELFRKQTTGSGNAGAGTGTPPTGRLDMNAVLRRAAGRT
jgi:hypothetical protein